MRVQINLSEKWWISFENSTSTTLTQNPEGNSTFFFYSSSNDFFFQIKIFLKVIFLSFPFGIIITKVKMFSVFFWLWYLINSHLCILIIKNIGIPSFIQSFRQYACEQSTVFFKDEGNIFWIHNVFYILTFVP